MLTHRIQDQPDPSAGFLFVDGFDEDLDLAVLGTWSSPYATHVRYAVKRPGAASATP